jgi:hypothetical protein
MKNDWDILTISIDTMREMGIIVFRSTKYVKNTIDELVAIEKPPVLMLVNAEED